MIEQIKAAKLRGRGGAGFLDRAEVGVSAQGRRPTSKYIICNADEGDPGAYMNRNEIESDPALAARRHDHRRLRHGRDARASSMCAPSIRWPSTACDRAIEQAREYGMLGDEHPGPRLQFRYRARRGRRRVRLRRGDGADRLARRLRRTSRVRVRLSPRRRASGASRPTSTTSRPGTTSPPIVAKGPGVVHRDRQHQERRARRCSRWSARCTNTGLVEMPLGTPLKKFIYDVGEGGIDGRADQGRADRRTIRRLHPAGDVRHAGGLRNAGAARLHHGLGRHGGDGRRQLHGGRRPLLHRVHAFRVVRQVHAVPRRAWTRRCAS